VRSLVVKDPCSSSTLVLRSTIIAVLLTKAAKFIRYVKAVCVEVASVAGWNAEHEVIVIRAFKLVLATLYTRTPCSTLRLTRTSLRHKHCTSPSQSSTYVVLALIASQSKTAII